MYFGRKIIANNQEQYQYLSEHLKNTAGFCRKFVNVFSDKAIGEFLGYYHDIGKYSQSFQKRICGAKITVAHARAGALECEKLYQDSNKSNFLYRLIGMAICGHHSGLMDYGTVANGYCQKISRKDDVEPYEDWQKEAPQPLSLDIRRWGLQVPNARSANLMSMELLGFTLQLYGRMLFSAVVDADRLDAQNFPAGQADYFMQAQSSLTCLQKKFVLHMEKLKIAAPQTPLNEVRNKIFQACLESAEGKPGLYSLTVPTGGGKTLSSMAFALSHAVKNSQQRIIYTIPFTSIIEQNAAIFKDIFGQENILEHHSNFILPNNNGTTAQQASNKFDGEVEIQYREACSLLEREQQLRLAQENWYEPIIVTTNVQFFESLFAHKPGKARKIHNIANSVIILDEAQSIPIGYLKPCMALLNELVLNYHCTVVLCTATQPEFDKNSLFSSDVQIKEMMPDVPALFAKLRRVKEIFLGEQTIKQIAERMVTEEQALCIVNTKRHAHELFCALGDSQTDIFHLSTNMTPQHRKATLKIIRQRLADNLPCKVISTQLIEAGVDIDFPVVFRAAAGIDSVAQAAGRCNREGRLKFGCVYVFVPEEIYRGKGYLRRTADCGLLTIQKYPQFLENTAVREYFSKLFDVERDGFDKKEIMQLCARSVADMPDLQIPYEKIGNAFKIIENEDYSLVIPQNDYVVNILGKAEYVKTLGGILRDLSQYTVGVKAYELAKLAEQGALNIIAGSIAVLVDENLYNDQYGLLLATTDQFDYIL